MDSIQIKNGYPPNYDKIKQSFDVEGKDILFAWGDTIYKPVKGDIPKHLMVHELIHCEQQKKFGGTEEWWDRYLIDSEFRLEQEVQAYASQYVYIKRLYKTGYSDQFLDAIASDLSSEIYGNIIAFDKARSRIKHFSRNMV